jgi:hypothetical protein
MNNVVLGTQHSDTKEEYPVDRVLAESDTPAGKRFLIKWLGYPLERQVNSSSVNMSLD